MGDVPPPTPYLDAWYESHDTRNAHDRPRVRLWWPTEAPWARLDTIEHGCHEPSTLSRPDAPTAHVILGSIEVGGDLAELEVYFAAVTDALRFARWQADNIAARMASEDENRVRGRESGAVNDADPDQPRTPPECPMSKRADEKHSWRFDGDDPYVICVFCDEMRDAHTERVIRPGRPDQPRTPTREDQR